MKIPHALLGILMVLLAAHAAVADDVIVLTNGREIHGRIVDERPEAVKIDIGGGKMTYRRDQIAEVRRASAAATAPAEGPGLATDPGTRREEHGLVYLGGDRAGTRVFRATKLPDGFLFEEELRVLDAVGALKHEMRSSERADPQFRPLSFQVRESDAAGEHRTVSGEVRSGRLWITTAKAGDRVKTDVAAPDGMQFPFAAREMFLRESKPLSGVLDPQVFDTRDGVFRQFSFREGGMRPLRMEGTSLEARVIVRRRGTAFVEREWIAPDGTAVLAELNGPEMLAIATTKQAVERLRTGDADRVTGADSAARTRYIDKERGWRIEKPDPTWTFEKPEVSGTGALLVVRNEPIFTTVDVMTDPDAPRSVTVEAAAEALQRLCRTVAPDFKVARDGWIDRGDERIYWMEATATTKGEPTRTLARVLVHGGRVYRVLAACPAKAFEALRPDLDKILESFRVE